MACCRWAYSGDDAEAVRRLAGSADWGEFLTACRRHRVQGLAWHALSKLGIYLPSPVQIVLAGDARSIAEQGLQSASESARLAAAFQAAGIPLLFLKGLTVGKLAYDNPFVKMGWDIDLLVAPEDLSRSADLLGELGYGLSIPAEPVRLARWHQSWKESIWRRADGIVVELHTRVADQPELLPLVGVSSSAQTVSIAPGIALQTLADEVLFAYLCVHGASSAWFRLKWLADLAGFLNRFDADAIDLLYERSQELGAGRAPAQALFLAHWLFAVPVSAALAQRLNSWSNNWLARSALRDMLQAEPNERLLGTRNIHLTQFFLLAGAGYKLSELKRQVRHAIDML